MNDDTDELQVPSDWRVTAPFTGEQVASLVRWQESEMVHPVTCPDRGAPPHPPKAVLTPTTAGWLCPHCPYTQDWVFDFLVDPGLE